MNERDKIHLVRSANMYDLYGIGHCCNGNDAGYCRGTYEECLARASELTYELIDHTK